MTQGKIVKISGPLVVAEGMQDADMFDVVRVGEQNLIGDDHRDARRHGIHTGI